jgi:hypothetical protein
MFRCEAEILSGSRGKAAEGRRTPKRWREFHGSREREASWSAPVPWRFPASARHTGITNARDDGRIFSIPDF